MAKFYYIKSKDQEGLFLVENNNQLMIGQRPTLFPFGGDAFTAYESWRTLTKLAGKETGQWEIKDVEL